MWQSAVFNDTITVNEADEGMDGETFFLYLFLVAMVSRGICLDVFDGHLTQIRLVLVDCRRRLWLNSPFAEMTGG